MRISKKEKSVEISGSSVGLQRDPNGVIKIFAKDDFEWQKGLGYAHAHDRTLQMIFTRQVAFGELSTTRLDSAKTLRLDLLIRKMRIPKTAQEEVAKLSENALGWAQAYCSGVNAYFKHHKPPFLTRILGIEVRPWELQDCLALILLQAYIGLAQVQENTERMIIQALQEGVDPEKLKTLFHPYLDDLAVEDLNMIRSAKIVPKYLKKENHFLQQFLPPEAMSNNWAVSPQKSASSHALLAFDPHLQVDRLPAIWAETVAVLPNDFRMGITLPGVPGVIMGRTKYLGASFTYGMMDVIDFFLEEIKGTQARRENVFLSLIKREEVIVRRKHPNATAYFFESNAGVLEREDSLSPTLEDGRYFSLAWNLYKQGGAQILESISSLAQAKDVFVGKKVLQNTAFSCNWVLADSGGNIAYQQSGLLAKRKGLGLCPLPAWEKENLWKGFFKGEELCCEINPDRGFVASANDDRNQEGYPLAVTIPFAPYRRNRIFNVLSGKDKLSIDDFKALQTDRYSLQAEKYMQLIRPSLPDTSLGNILRNWDCIYTKNSEGAILFEKVYAALLKEAFGKPFLGETAWEEIATQKGLLIYLHGHFDRLLFCENNNWLQSNIPPIVEKTLSSLSKSDLKKSIKHSHFWVKNLFFFGKLPKWLGFDYGPLSLQGSRATVWQGGLFRGFGPAAAIGPSYRFVSDLGKMTAETVLAGGASEKRFSKTYIQDLRLWDQGEYKTLRL